MRRPTFRELYDEQFRFVWRSLHRLGVRESDVPDVLQEVFVVVHRKLAEFEGNAKITSWLFGICIRVASEHRRSPVTRREVASDDVLLNVRDESARDPTEHIDAQQKRALLYRLVDELPEEQRAVFLLFELEGLSGDEIADLVAVPVGTVRSRLRLAREGFRRLLARAGARDAFPPTGAV